jgi:hypothetical protein
MWSPLSSAKTGGILAIVPLIKQEAPFGCFDLAGCPKARDRRLSAKKVSRDIWGEIFVVSRPLEIAFNRIITCRWINEHAHCIMISGKESGVIESESFLINSLYVPVVSRPLVFFHTPGRVAIRYVLALLTNLCSTEKNFLHL